jgi:hypothetical protein
MRLLRVPSWSASLSLTLVLVSCGGGNMPSTLLSGAAAQPRATLGPEQRDSRRAGELHLLSSRAPVIEGGHV